MKKISTQKCTKEKAGKVVAPSENTLNFLKQFARSYYVEKALPKTINDFCIN